MSKNKNGQKELFPEEAKNANPSPKLVSLLDRIERIYEEQFELDEWEIYRKWIGVERFCSDFRKGLEHADVKRLIQFGEKFRQMKGPGRYRIEEGLFKLLYQQLYFFRRMFNEDEFPFPIDRNEIDAAAESERKPGMKEELARFLDIETFALDSYTFKRARDSFAGNRRAFPLNLLMELIYYFKSAKGLELARKSLKNKNSTELHAAFDFLKHFYVRMDKDVEDDLYEQLIKMSEKTKKREVASGALDVLVRTGTISDWEALDRIDEWKQENGYT